MDKDLAGGVVFAIHFIKIKSETLFPISNKISASYTT